MWPFNKPEVRVLVVCTANICRSPAAEGLLKAQLKRLGLGRKVLVSSAGIAAEGAPRSPDPRILALAREVGASLRGVRSSPLEDQLVEDATWIWGMDAGHIDELQKRYPDTKNIGLFDPAGEQVLDPYFGSKADVRLAFEKIAEIAEARALEIRRALT